MTSKTISLTGTETKIEYSGGCNAWLRNDGASAIYASAAPEVMAGADGVVSIPAGQTAPIYGANGTVYLLGTGSVMLIGSDYAECPFKTSAQSGGSGADDVARAAIEAHAGNADIHVTAAEKSAWDAKADISDIPASLPANGGNADTVGNKGTADLIAGYTLSDNYLAIPANSDLNSYVSNGLYLASDSTLSKTLENTPFNTSGFYLAVYVRNKTNILQCAMAWDGTEKRRMYNGSSWGDWISINSRGNAASVGAYTEEKLAALEARIAKLEANNG